MTRLAFDLTWPMRRVRAARGRHVAAVLAVALGVALVVATRLMNAAVLDAFLSTVDGVSGRAALMIAAGEGATFDEDVVRRVGDVPGVALAVPLVRAVAFPDDGSGELLTVHGVDVTHDAAVRLYHRADGELVDDPLVFLNQPDSVIVGREFAERRGIRVGDGIPLVTPSGVQRFTVRGLLEPEGLARTLGGRLVVMDLYAAQRAFTADGRINQVDVVLDAAAEPATVAARIAPVLPPGLAVEEPRARKDLIRSTVRGFQTMLSGFALLAVVAGFVICYSRLRSIFEARTWEIGLLRAVGLRRSVVFVEMLKESLLLGLLGTGVGIPLGVAIGGLALPLITTATALNFHLPVPATPPIVWRATDVLVGAVVGVVAATVAAAAPALRLARTEPVAALALRGRDAVDQLTLARSLAGTLVLLVGVVLIAAQQASGSPVLGHAATALVAVAGCALARPLVRAADGPLARAWEWAFGPSGRFAVSHLGQQARRASLSVATIGLGLGSVLMFGILGWSFERTLVAQVASRLEADLVVTSAFESGGWVSAPVHEEVVAALRGIDGVAAAVGEQRRDVAYRGGVAILDGYDPACFTDARLCTWPLERGALPDALRLVADGRGALVSTAFAHQFAAAPGDTVTFASPSGPQPLLVVGVTRAEPTAAAIFSRDRYRAAWNDALVTWAHVALDGGATRAAVEDRIRRALGERHRIRVPSGAELIQFFADQARAAFSVLYVMQAITFLLVLIGIGDTLATGVRERTRQLGMMRAVGLSQGRVFRMVLLEAAAIAVLGLAIAGAVGAGLGLLWVESQFPAILGWQLDLHVPARLGVATGGLTLVLCLLAAVVPAARAARLSVGVALREE